MAAPLPRLRRTRLADQAATEIKRLIATGAYAAGARLPSEGELAEALGITRLTVREALSSLEAAGLTNTRHGSGTYVVDLEAMATLDLLAILSGAGKQLSPAECVELMEFRGIVIAGFAEMLAARVQPAHLLDLRRVIADEREAVGDAARLGELDWDFNHALARASGNLFYTLLMRSIRAIHVQIGAIVFSERKDDELIIATQEAVVTALESRRRAKLDKSLATYLDGGTAIIRGWWRRQAKR